MKKAFLALFVVFFALNVQAATIQGNTFEWYTLEKLNNVVVDINSVPIQSKVAENSFYSFQVPKGDYLITGKYYKNNLLELETEEFASIEDDGNYTIDLIMFPALEEEFLVDSNLLEGLEITEVEEVKGFDLGNTILLLAALAVAAIAGYLAYLKKFAKPKQIERKNTERRDYAVLEEEKDNEEEAIKEKEEIRFTEEKGIQKNEEMQKSLQEKEEKPKVYGLDSKAKEVLQALKKSSGRLTQKELREKLPQYSEAMISLIVAELESDGRVKKIKQGRGNIIVLRQKTSF